MSGNRNDDRFARESFTFRWMRGWQPWAIAGAVVILLILYLVAM